MESEGFPLKTGKEYNKLKSYLMLKSSNVEEKHSEHNTFSKNLCVYLTGAI